jgi:hypothetical protein
MAIVCGIPIGKQQKKQKKLLETSGAKKKMRPWVPTKYFGGDKSISLYALYAVPNGGARPTRVTTTIRTNMFWEREGEAMFALEFRTLASSILQAIGE